MVDPHNAQGLEYTCAMKSADMYGSFKMAFLNINMASYSKFNIIHSINRDGTTGHGTTKGYSRPKIWTKTKSPQITFDVERETFLDMCTLCYS